MFRKKLHDFLNKVDFESKLGTFSASFEIAFDPVIFCGETD